MAESIPRPLNFYKFELCRIGIGIGPWICFISRRHCDSCIWFWEKGTDAGRGREPGSVILQPSVLYISPFGCVQGEDRGFSWMTSVAWAGRYSPLSTSCTRRVSHTVGVQHEIFDFRFFHGSFSRGPLSIPLGPIRIFTAINEKHFEQASWYLAMFHRQCRCHPRLINRLCHGNDGIDENPGQGLIRGCQSTTPAIIYIQ